jgi:hypothetical protein
LLFWCVPGPHSHALLIAGSEASSKAHSSGMTVDERTRDSLVII